MASHCGFCCFCFVVWLHWVFVAVQPFSSCRKQRLLSGCGAWASPCGGFSCCGARLSAHGLSTCGSRVCTAARRFQDSWHSGSVVMTQGLVALQPVESPHTRGWPCVPCIGRQIPIHCTTWGVLIVVLMSICLRRKDSESILSCAYGSFVYFLCRNINSNLLSLKQVGWFVFFLLKISLFIYSRRMVRYTRDSVCKHLLPFCPLSFYFLDKVLCTKLFNVTEVQFT